MAEVAHALYRFWNAGGELLYVGISVNPYGRFDAHQKTKPWWGEIANITIQAYPDRGSVLQAELEAIECEHPAYNIQHNSAVTVPAYAQGYDDGYADGANDGDAGFRCAATQNIWCDFREDGVDYGECPTCESTSCEGWLGYQYARLVAVRRLEEASF